MIADDALFTLSEDHVACNIVGDQFAAESSAIVGNNYDFF